MMRATARRCLSSALQNQDLPTALRDCNTAMHRADKKNENYAFLFVSRGLVRLRQGDYDKAIADFSDALEIMPKNARAVYARPVAESRKNNKKESETDLEAAMQIPP